DVDILVSSSEEAEIVKRSLRTPRYGSNEQHPWKDGGCLNSQVSPAWCELGDDGDLTWRKLSRGSSGFRSRELCSRAPSVYCKYEWTVYGNPLQLILKSHRNTLYHQRSVRIGIQRRILTQSRVHADHPLAQPSESSILHHDMTIVTIHGPKGRISEPPRKLRLFCRIFFRPFLYSNSGIVKLFSHDDRFTAKERGRIIDASTYVGWTFCGVKPTTSQCRREMNGGRISSLAPHRKEKHTLPVHAFFRPSFPLTSALDLRSTSLP
ncbi:hypothetical protein ARMSODRAFT_984082, partial [Armillaria solidipes]